MKTKKCSKCERIRELNFFHKDKEKADGLYPSCKDCRNDLYGIMPRTPKQEKECNQCGKKFFPRNLQIATNTTGKYFCTWKHKSEFMRDNAVTYYSGYRPYILTRDQNKCVLCSSSENLHVHHIMTRGSGGTNEYRNLCTLCAICHSTKSHGIEASRYRENLMSLLSKTERPEWWDKVMEQSNRETLKVKKHINALHKKWYYKIKSSPLFNEIKEKRKIDYKKRMKAYKEKHGMTYFQYLKKFGAQSKPRTME